jgi:small subunit ribosomal protein S6
MPQETPIYDLMLLLSTGVEEERRAKILGDVETTINGAQGSIAHNADWGTRPMAYRIDHQAEAEYHLLQFTGPTSLLESLGHTLGITDGVLRHRIIKVLPGTPPPPTPDRVAVPAPPPAPAAETDPGPPAEVDPGAASADAAPDEALAPAAEPTDSAPTADEPDPAALAPEEQRSLLALLKRVGESIGTS